MIFERGQVTPVMTPRKTNPTGAVIPLFSKEEKKMRDEAEQMGGINEEIQSDAVMKKGTREPVVLINVFIMVIEAVIPVAMAFGLLPQEQADSLKALIGSLMALVVAVGDFAAVLMIRDQVTPVKNPLDMKGEPLTE